MKKLLAVILACVMVIPALVGCGSVATDVNDLKDDVISSNESVNLNNTEKNQEVTAYPVEKAFVRSGNNWKDLNWRVIISQRGINQNNAEPLVIKNGGGEYTRYIYLTYDISEFKIGRAHV